MVGFEYCSPTKIVFGKDAEKKVGKLVKEQGCKKVLVHYGGHSAKASGLLDRVFASLEEAGVDYCELGGVVPNPHLSKVYEGIELAKKEGVDFLLAVGGGSVIDSSKAIAYGIANPDVDDVWKFYAGEETPKACAPVGAILTIAAAGSETSNSSVITNEDGWLKRGLGSELCRPRFAIMNPELTYTLPAYQTASGGVDIMMHTMERYFQQEGYLDITNGIAESLLKTMVKYLPIAVEDPTNYRARAEIMWCGSLSHIDMTHLGGTRGDWSCHQIEHELGGMFDVAHGAGLGSVWASWARYVYKDLPSRFAEFATDVMGVEPGATEEETALKGMAAFEEFLRKIHMPTSLHELGVDPTEEEIEEMAYKCTFMGKRQIGAAGVRALGQEDIAAIYRMAL